MNSEKAFVWAKSGERFVYEVSPDQVTKFKLGALWARKKHGEFMIKAALEQYWKKYNFLDQPDADPPQFIVRLPRRHYCSIFK